MAGSHWRDTKQEGSQEELIMERHGSRFLEYTRAKGACGTMKWGGGTEPRITGEPHDVGVKPLFQPHHHGPAHSSRAPPDHQEGQTLDPKLPSYTTASEPAGGSKTRVQGTSTIGERTLKFKERVSLYII